MTLRHITILAATVLALSALVISQATAQVKAGSKLKAEMRVCTGILEREPQGTDTSFGAQTNTVYCWSRITGTTADETITHAWSLNGQEVSRTDLKVGPDANPVWSQKNLFGRVGSWEVRALDANGKVIGRVAFTVK